jgi:hypothetical protein
LSLPIGLIILGMLNFMNEWYTPGGSLTPEQLGDSFYALIREGVAQPAT